MTVLESVGQEYRQLLSQHHICRSHDFNHSKAVLAHTINSLKFYTSQEATIESPDLVMCCQLAALLHDADDHKLFPHNHNDQNARMLMAKANISQETIDKVIQMIRLVSFSKNPEGSEPSNLSELYLYPRYADRLEAVGLPGVVRAYEYNMTTKRPLTTASTPMPRNKEELELVIKGRDALYIKKGGHSDSFIDHFYDKLLHIDCHPHLSAHNQYFRTEFLKRREYLKQFILKVSNAHYENLEEELDRLRAQYYHSLECK